MTGDVELDNRSGVAATISGGAGIENGRVSVVVMSRDRHDELLSSLDRHRAGVIYVDNASTDGSVNTYRFQDNFAGNF